MTYEFKEEEETIISHVGIIALILSAVIIIGGIFDVLVVFNQFEEEGIGAIFFLIIFGLIQVIIGGSLFLPANNFRRIAETEGRDVEEMMSGLNKMNQVSQLAIAILSTGVILMLAAFVVFG